MDVRMKDLGTRVRDARSLLNLTQNELAEKAQLHPTYISAIENGKVNMSVDVLMRLTEALQVSSDWLLQAETPVVSALQTNEIVEMLSDCSVTELKTISKMIKEIKAALRSTKE